MQNIEGLLYTVYRCVMWTHWNKSSLFCYILCSLINACAVGVRVFSNQSIFYTYISCFSFFTFLAIRLYIQYQFLCSINIKFFVFVIIRSICKLSTMLLRQFLIKANVVFYDKGSIVDLTFYGGGLGRKLTVNSAATRW